MMKKFILIFFLAGSAFAAEHRTVATPSGGVDVTLTAKELEDYNSQQQEAQARRAAVEKELAAAEKQLDLEKKAPDILVKAIEALSKGEALPPEYLDYKQSVEAKKAAGAARP